MIVFASKKQKVNKQSTTLCTIDTTYVGKKKIPASHLIFCMCLLFHHLYELTIQLFV